ncbi:BRO family protein [uncultured Campylobacter sp.]|uniref:BRO-N domain-containing protein n=1 Tax=uncultured Campylobacter sp. TaxID=218934 RepID=UPI002604DABB|nr:BRO family protein [uncultured Campylobacter sp.]
MNLEIFKNENFEIRVTVDETGEPLFCLADVCKVLELTTPAKVAEAIKSEFEGSELNSYPFETVGGRQNFTMITEPQLYFVLMRSNKPNAKPFRMWVNKEVLPSIRKTGSYTQKPLSQIEILQGSVEILAAHEKDIKVIKNDISDLHKEQLKARHNINRLLNNDNYMTLIEYMNLNGISQKGYHIPSLGKKATRLSNEQGAFMGAVIDPRYGRVNTYSTEILRQIFYVDER